MEALHPELVRMELKAAGGAARVGHVIRAIELEFG
jgi:hypothetical protein